ncbi:MAG TPA: multiheme c-type cytochrome [Anaerohalosphaeraceae bacterium]|jgi:hydroxylamine dehydrogenase|nr:multiheme c-type cytochrome [Anaerohalosphaeraceae bacterium]HRT50207.1 multiheme c-type cytochrome [Anaerohalosphaeraceae bacterium]HRT86138.1 multiheme c-type cytochrome [Anaerohalosphaeraceae bacterium]
MRLLAILHVVLFVVVLCCPLVAAQDETLAVGGLKTIRIERNVSATASGCIECHSQQMPALVADWADSRHAHMNITCLDCHAAGPADSDYSKKHLGWEKTRVSPVVSPKDCSRCHPTEAAEYDRSKHARTLEIMWSIDPWLNEGLNNEVERITGCEHCHGSVVKALDGKLDPATWPNTGVGRINPDGSRGSCSSCHTRHKFSLAEARKPEACGQCHLGPDHPQIEIYNESKHGAIYHAEGHAWNWGAPPGAWAPGVDYRTPTCSVCHMSQIGGVDGTHDVTERLAWETQAPLTIRPSEFKPLPAKTKWREEREKMKGVCRACHSSTWAEGHFDRLDKAVENYNEIYYKPARKLIDELYEKNLLSRDKALDEKLEIDMYELWHHEGRRARFGAAMMAPDYAWWHGFYELKKRCMEIEAQAEELKRTGKPATVHEVKGATGDTTKPALP